jgi:hypothetical protein
MLQSLLLRDDPQLQACAAHDAAHLIPGSGGAGVGRLQLAMLALGAPAIDLAELKTCQYGPSTAASVLAYKQRRGIVNRSYQQQADNIAGRMTLAQVDRELCALEGLCSFRPSQRDPLVDSAPAFALRVALVNALAVVQADAGPSAHWTFGGPPGSAAAAETGRAAEFADTLIRTSATAAQKVLRTIGRVERNPRQSVSAEPGLWRDGICRTATQVPALGKRFEEPPVSSCWSLVRTVGKLDKPLAEEQPIQTNWCGIFATWLWWMAGHDVIWVSGVGPSFAKGGRRVKTSSLIPMLAPGDIIVEAFGSKHHMLVLSIACDRSKAEIIEGNAGAAAPDKTKVNLRSLNLPKDGTNHWFYSVDSLRDPSVNYGYNIPEATAAPPKPNPAPP